jgi:hypothetical protein
VADDGTLQVSLGDLASAGEVRVRWRVRLGPGSQRGDGAARVQALSVVANASSNSASAVVRVRGGVFSDRGIIFGKVFLDCDCDDSTSRATQETHEVGVPGVRLIMQDGTTVITDAEGKYSLPGLAARLHVVKLDGAANSRRPISRCLAATRRCCWPCVRAAERRSPAP